MSIQVGGHSQAKFNHAGGMQLGLRMQAFVTVRDDDGRVALLRIEDFPNGWVLPGESMNVNEAPEEAAARVAKMWFTSPLKDVTLKSVESYPATGPDDPNWYLLFLFEARADGELKGTPDTSEIKWAKPGDDPGPFAMAHADVWARLR